MLEKEKTRLTDLAKRFLPALAINWVLPVALVMLLHRYSVGDTAALAVAGAVPVVHTLTVFLWRRRVDWTGVLGILGFAAALVIAVLSGGSPLPLKLYHPAVAGSVGLLLLGSVIIGKPLLAVLLSVMELNGIEQLKALDSHKKLSVLTTVLGLVFAVDAGIHVAMAFTLPTVTYVFMSRVVIGSLILIAVAGGMIARRKLS